MRIRREDQKSGVGVEEKEGVPQGREMQKTLERKVLRGGEGAKKCNGAWPLKLGRMMRNRQVFRELSKWQVDALGVVGTGVSSELSESDSGGALRILSWP